MPQIIKKVVDITKEDKTAISTIVNTQLQNIPNLVQFSENENVRENLGISSSFDFVMGIVYDGMLVSINNYFLQKMKIKQPTREQFMEIMEVATSETLSSLTEIKSEIKKQLNN